ncbi:hypothetical protein FHX74_003634 [Friedmanniella endophytica]|uniref:DUF2723 domain-containing protein n=1 Tax=Microlunatus kandeliicorticis TaxID=1759536 RepID=A0A7W3IVF1_9ACTN|nr:DUF2723 domain-containing protein [Microlunatus kandeliicorticis]MBA8795993.1 hypothetical protein [Microlunatus kandeliicorticis]
MTDQLTAVRPATEPARVPRSLPGRRRAELWPYLATTMVLSVLYARTLQPSTGNAVSMDTTKFDFLGLVLGTGHPPGYPVYTLLNALAVRVLPFGSVAGRANALSAVFAVACACLLVAVFRSLGLRRSTSAAGATAIALLPAVWQFSVVAEIYTMALLFVVGVLFCLVRYEVTGRRGWLRAGVLVLAFSFAHAISNVLLVPGLLLYLAVRRVRWLFRARELAWLLPTSAVLAVVPYFYLWWRTVAPALYVDVRVDSVPSLVDAITGARYGPRMFAVPSADLPGRVDTLLAIGWEQFGVTLLLVVLGLVTALAVRRRALLTGVLALWVVCTVVFLLDYDVDDWTTMLLPVWTVLGVWGVLGLDHLLTAVTARIGDGTPRRRRVTALLAPVVGVALVLSAAVHGFGTADRSWYDPQPPVDAAISRAGHDAIIFTADYSTRFQFHYRLLPDRWGERRRLWSAKGAVYDPGPHHWTAVIRAYCAANADGADPAIGDVPQHLRTYVFGSDYAERVAGEKLRTTRVSGELYRVSCPG